MSEKNTNVTETVEIDQAMGVMPEEVDPGMSVMPGPGVADTPTVIPELDSMLAVVLDQLPAYTTTDWKNKPSTATPVTAEIMKKIEQRLVDLTSAYNNQAAEIKELRDSVSRVAFIEPDTRLRISYTEDGGLQIGIRDTPFYVWFSKKKGIGIWDSSEHKNYTCSFDTIK